LFRLCKHFRSSISKCSRPDSKKARSVKLSSRNSRILLFSWIFLRTMNPSV
jgi:hypothetical protein